MFKNKVLSGFLCLNLRLSWSNNICLAILFYTIGENENIGARFSCQLIQSPETNAVCLH